MVSNSATSVPQPSVFPLTRLAPDIQYAIYQSLCCHCTSESDAMTILHHDPCQQTEILRNLCLVSRRTKSLVQSILYHFPRIYSYTAFFRTLRARPDLAGQVKVVTWVYKEDASRPFYPKCLTPGRDLTPREDISYLRSLALELKLEERDTESLEFARTFEQYPKSADEAVEETFKQEMHKAFDNLIISIMLGLCPRLEFASLNLDDGQELDRLQLRPVKPMRFQYLSGLIRQNPSGFPSLRTLVIHNTLHNDPNVLNIGSISFLWKALSNLQHLLFFRGFAECEPEAVSPACNDQLDHVDAQRSLCSLKELRFVRYSRYERLLPLPAITSLVSKCTQLERFSFSPMGMEGKAFPPLQLVHALSTASYTLRELIINCPILETYTVDVTQLITDLRQFLQLQSLVLDQSVFCRHYYHPSEDIPPDCLTGILPPSLSKLTINMHSPCTSVVDLVALGAAIVNGGFINLRHLRVQMIFIELSEDDVPESTSRSEMNREALLALLEKLSDTERSPWSCWKSDTRQMLLQAFEATSVALDVDCFSGSLYNAWNLEMLPPHSLCYRFNMNLVQDEL